jgi:TM2 domain-containing membrane protein YozV
VSDLGDKCEAYFKTITGIGKKEHMEFVLFCKINAYQFVCLIDFRICLSLVERYLKYIADVYKSLAVTQLEVAALSGIILLNSGKR